MNAERGVLADLRGVVRIARAASVGVTGNVPRIERAEQAIAAVAALIEAVSVQRGIAEMSGPWKTPDVRQNWARLVGLDQFATRADITAKADANVAAALARAERVS